MTRYVVLLRGVNVGGHNKVPMAELRATLEGAGFTDVATYIQSGNVALSGSSCRADEIRALIARDFGLDIPVVIRTADQLSAVIAGNPFPNAEAEPKRLLVFFCSSVVPEGALEGFDHDRYLPDRVVAGSSELYVVYEVGLGSSKLNNAVLDRAAGSPTTARNWSTVLKLYEMAAER